MYSYVRPIFPSHIIILRGSQIIVAGIIQQLWNYFVENFLPCERQGYLSQLEDTPENEEIKRPNKARVQKKEITWLSVLKNIKTSFQPGHLRKLMAKTCLNEMPTPCSAIDHCCDNKEPFMA